jgi:LacI family transcriptional regulator
MPTTLKEIAYQAGVDVSVVSRVINGKADKYRISKACQERVKGVALELGYIPNAYAVGMKQGEFHCVALLQNTMADQRYLPEKLVDEISRCLEIEDKHLLLASMPQQRLNKEELPKIFRSLMADGLIINDCHDLPPRLRNVIEHTSMPTVWINRKMDFNAVYPDSFWAAKKATEHLISLGHKKICYCNVYFDDLRPNAHYSVADRRDGYALAMKEASLDKWDITPQHRVDDAMEKQIELFCSVLKSESRPTAMLLYWSYSIPAVFSAASRLGLHIPHDLSIIAFAGESHQRRGLTASAMLEPETDMGRTAVSMLQERMRTKQDNIPSKVLQYIFLDIGTCSKVAPNL